MTTPQLALERQGCLDKVRACRTGKDLGGTVAEAEG